jgi:hypothetical protein
VVEQFCNYAISKFSKYAFSKYTDIKVFLLAIILFYVKGLLRQGTIVILLFKDQFTRSISGRVFLH